MKLIKIEDGLIEQEDFFLTSPLGDLLGDYQYYRTANEFVLTSGFVEREFPYNEFVLIVEKNPVVLQENEKIRFYVREGDNISGLSEEYESGTPSSKYLKIVQYAGGIQGYRSEDGKKWENKGGGQIENNYNIQGFSTEGVELVIKNYSLYRSPYISIYNVPFGHKLQLINQENEVVNERLADENDLVELFIEHPLEGKIRHLDSAGLIVSETDSMSLKYGDAFFKYDYDIIVKYQGVVLDYNPTRLNTRKEKITVKNQSNSENYEDLRIVVNNETVDDIKISYNNLDFQEYLDLDSIEPQEEVEVYIQIIKNTNYPSWGIRKFGIEIDNALVFEEGGGA